jgi:Flp pilus assembly protein TadG
MVTSRNRRGIALVWTVIVLLVMIGMVGLSIDWGWTTLDASKLQNAGDAAALAGAMRVKQGFHDGDMGSTYAAARSLSMANYAAGAPVDVCYDAATNDPSLDVVVGRWFPSTRYFEPLDLSSGNVPNAVKVMTRHVQGWAVNQPLALNFGPIFGVERANVLREAIAINAGGGGAALVCLAPDKGGLEINGGGKINVSLGPVQGEIWVDSFLRSGKGAVYPNSNGAPDPAKGWYIDCAGLYTCGTVDPSIMEYFGEPPNYLYPVFQELSVPIPDPLWQVPALDVGAMNPRNESPANLYGMVVKVDPTTGEPLKDGTGAYIPATNSKGKTFNVAAANPITSSTVGDFGQLIGGRKTLTATPGYYPGGFAQTSSGSELRTIKMLPGVYAVGGGASNGDKSGMILNGGALDARGVMIYVTNSKLDGTGNYGRVDISGSYEYIKLLEYEYLAGDPTYYQEYDYKNYGNAGMAIFQDRRNPMDGVVIGGGNNMTMDGTLYFHCTGQADGTPTPPAGSVPGGPWDVTLEVGGSSGQTGIQMIVDRLLVHGDADVIVKYDGRNFQPSNIVYLVK